MSIHAYQNAATRSENPRETEYRVFGAVTAGLIRAKELGRVEVGVLSEAIHQNRRLWKLLAADCAEPGNTLPHATRAQIISLALFVERHSGVVMREGGDIEPLIDINRSIMEGLAGR